jgi:aspartate/methionine/tyrosine aminotransferase
VSPASRRLPPSLESNPWAERLAALRAAGHELVDLTVANPTRAGLTLASPETLAALTDARAAEDRPDPRGLPRAREAVAGYLGARGTRVDPGHVVLTSGTSESYAHLFRLLADPGDVVLAPAPSYPLIEPIARLEGLEVVWYRLGWDGAWHLDLGALDRALDDVGERARALVTIEPNHPTGTCLASEERLALEDRLAARGLSLIADEVFGDFPCPPRSEPFAGWLGARRVPTFVLGGLSKTCGLPQLKLGWIAAAGPEPETGARLEGLEWIADLFLTVSAPVQHAAAALLAARGPYQERVRARLAANLGALAEFVRAHPEASTRAGEGGWTAIVDLPAAREDDWSLALLERSVVVHPSHFYDLDSRGAIVLSLIPDPERFRAGLERIGAALASR